MSLVEKLEIYAANHLNVLLIGSHGIGKSTIVKAIAEKLNLKFKYYSASTLDPFADLVGIPSPDKEAGALKFYRPKDLEDAEFIMFDELNRAHPRVLNAVLEIIQFKSVNGYTLPHLKMVWAAMNPPGENYAVEELDPALVDRFHQYIKMQAEINLEYLSTRMKPDVAKMLKGWWETCLSDEQKKLLTPRRIEYLGMMISKDIPWRDAMPQGHPMPEEELARRIRILRKEEDDLVVTREGILENTNLFIKSIKLDPKMSISVATVVGRLTEEEIFQCRDLVEALPKELVKNIGKSRFPMRRRILQDIFKVANIDMQTSYPKLAEAFQCAFKEE
jgi:MoxR-like ATPase